MTIGQTTYRLGADVPAGQILRDSKGREVDEDYVDAAVEDAIEHVRGRGRPSLSKTGESPLLRVRISREVADWLCHQHVGRSLRRSIGMVASPIACRRAAAGTCAEFATGRV